jgi:sirohydrochlorin ferrochelatase
MRKIVNLFFSSSIFILVCLIAVSASAGDKETMGVVVITHGAPMPQWNKKAIDFVASVKCQHPIEPAFLDFAGERTLEKAVRNLETKGANNILIVHLSPSSYSNHHEELSYLVGLRKDLGFYTEHTDTPIKSPSRFAVSPCMDDHPLAAEILTQYARELSREPAKESLMLIGHGPVEEVENIMWVRQLARIGKQITKSLPFKEVACMTLRSDSADLIREQAHEDLRETALRLSAQGRVIVVVYSVGSSLLQREVQHIMKGIPSIAFSNKGILEHPNAVKWVEATIQKGMNQTPVPPINRKWTNMDQETGKPPGTTRYGLL